VLIKSTSASMLRFLWRDNGCRFRDASHARQFLSQFKSDPVAMASLRTLVGERDWLHSPARLSDDEVIKAVGSLLARGDLVAGFEWKPRIKAPVKEEAEAAGAASPSREPQAQEPDPNTFGGDHDAAAQAAALSAAAQSGVPFCEECARAAQGGAQQ
jgi:hypothetical protein